tara:strand:- start:265 stop:552 length:288 start_codon:yes stop_codon:yes gene_type:complete
MITKYKPLNDLFKATCRVVFSVKDKNPLDLAIIKGKGWAYYSSYYDKAVIPVKKGSAWYVLNDPPNENGEYKLFYPSKLFYGQVIWVPREEFTII